MFMITEDGPEDIEQSESKTAQPTDGEIYLEAERISKAVHVFPFDKVSWQYGAQAMRDGLIPKR